MVIFHSYVKSPEGNDDVTTIYNLWISMGHRELIPMVGSFNIAVLCRIELWVILIANYRYIIPMTSHGFGVHHFREIPTVCSVDGMETYVDTTFTWVQPHGS